MERKGEKGKMSSGCKFKEEIRKGKVRKGKVKKGAKKGWVIKNHWENNIFIVMKKSGWKQKRNNEREEEKNEWG